MGVPSRTQSSFDGLRQHRVRITRPFYLGVYEVTQKDWMAVMGTTPWQDKQFVVQGDRYPATYVTWEDATEFCRKLTAMERDAGRLKVGEAYRLPTEAEWEYACRAGTTKRYHFGDDDRLLGENAWCRRNSWDLGERCFRAVGTKNANSWGLFDMHGNVWEWCSDWYSWRPYYRSEFIGLQVDPQGPSEDARLVDGRVARGGGWSNRPGLCNSAVRIGVDPVNRRSAFHGFRVVRTIAPSE